MIEVSNIGAGLKIKLDEYAFHPTRAHSTDAGLDICTPSTVGIDPRSSVVIDSGVHVQLPPGTVGMLKSKSGLNVKYGITSEGVIDEGYTGEIKVKLYNHSDQTIILQAGNKITQLVILPVIVPEYIEYVDELDSSERGNKGFGSSGR